jgi:hypothetical protein
VIDPWASLITIRDPGSIRVTGTFDARDTTYACPVAAADIFDRIQFAIVLDSQLVIQIGAIQNQPTTTTNVRFFNVDSGSLTAPLEAFELVSGSVVDTSAAGELSLMVRLMGTSMGGACQTTTMGQTTTYMGFPLPTMLGFEIVTGADGKKLIIVNQTAFGWTFTAEYIEG